MSSNYPVDPSNLRTQGTKGVMAAVGGVGLWVVNSLMGVPILGWIIGGGLVVFGLTGIFGKSRTDKTSGGIMMAAGAAGLVSLVLPGLRSFLLGAGGLALVAYGAVNILKFIKGLRSRS
jgi:hypothetical protein